MVFKGRKASLELSISTIVIVVLAMTLLGLGLGFIKNMFGDVSRLSDTTFQKVSENLQSNLINSNERLMFSETKISAERGKSYLMAWGIKNDYPTQLDYWTEFNALKCPQGTCPTLEELNTQWFTFKYDPNLELYRLSAADQHVKRVDLNVPKNAPPGLYFVEVSVYERTQGAPDIRNNLYASTEIFITVS